MHIKMDKLQLSVWLPDLAPVSAVKRVTSLPLALGNDDVIAFFHLAV
jgi:hypothetical protein